MNENNDQWTMTRNMINANPHKYNAYMLLGSHPNTIAHMTTEEARNLVVWCIANQINPNTPQHARMINNYFESRARKKTGLPGVRGLLYFFLVAMGFFILAVSILLIVTN